MVEQKATVQKLTPNDLKIFMATDLNLSELYKLKNLNSDSRHAEEHTYNNLTIIENILRDTEIGRNAVESVKTPLLKQIVEEIKEVEALNTELEEEAHDVIER